MGIESINRLYETEFRGIPFSERAIFIPHCLRHKECKAERSIEGIICINCGRCNIGSFKKEAEALGYRVFIVPGASIIKKIIEKYKFKAVLGVACLPELKQGIELMKKRGIAALAVPLLKDGCVDTKVDWNKVKAITNLK